MYKGCFQEIVYPTGVTPTSQKLHKLTVGQNCQLKADFGSTKTLTRTITPFM